MEVKLVISLDEATQELVKELLSVAAGKSLANTRTERSKTSKKATKEITELSDVDNLGGVDDDTTTDFVDELDAIDKKKSRASKSKKAASKDADDADEKITIEDVRSTLAAKKKAGFGAGIKAVLKKYGVTMVSDLDAADYAEVIKEVEALK